MRITKKKSFAALAASAALVAAAVTTGAAGAAPVRGEAAPAPGGAAVPLSAQSHAALLGSADARSAETARELGLGGKEKLVVKDVVKNEDGATHTRFKRTYDGLPVIGGDLIVHRDGGGDIDRVTRPVKAKIAVPSTEAPTAHRPVASKAEGSKAPVKVIYAAQGKPTLAWETVIGGFQKDGTPNRMHVITDAATGKKLEQFQAVHHASGESLYSGTVEVGSKAAQGGHTLTDTARGDHQTLDAHNEDTLEGDPFIDKDDKWGDGTPANRQTAAVDAAYGAALTFDYYKNVHGRDGILGDGKGATSNVHYRTNYKNAFWIDDCFCMTYGGGEGDKKPLTSIDIATHEMTHGVSSATAGFSNGGEAGALDEATSDIFAAAVEFSAKNSKDVGDYLVAEKVDINGDGTPLRYMDKPSKDGKSLDYWKPDAAGEGRHRAAGIGNHFFYLLSEGSGAKEINGVKYDSPTADGSKVEGIGRDKAAKIWFKALTEEMVYNTDYAAARKVTVKAATGLYGAGSAEVKAVEAAWTAVKVA